MANSGVRVESLEHRQFLAARALTPAAEILAGPTATDRYAYYVSKTDTSEPMMNRIDLKTRRIDQVTPETGTWSVEQTDAFIRIGGRMLAVVSDGPDDGDNRTIWAIDDGSRVARSLVHLPNAVNIEGGAEEDGRFVFSVYLSHEVWATDGTVAGTKRVVDASDDFWFRASLDRTLGRGTMFRQIVRSSPSRSALWWVGSNNQLTKISFGKRGPTDVGSAVVLDNGDVVATADASDGSGVEFWRVTPEGAVSHFEVDGISDALVSITPIGNRMLLASSGAVWLSDLTAAGTRQLAKFDLASSDSQFSSVQVIRSGSRVFVSHYSSDGLSTYGRLTFDGKPASPVQLLEFSDRRSTLRRVAFASINSVSSTSAHTYFSNRNVYGFGTTYRDAIDDAHAMPLTARGNVAVARDTAIITQALGGANMRLSIDDDRTGDLGVKLFYDENHDGVKSSELEQTFSEMGIDPYWVGIDANGNGRFDKADPRLSNYDARDGILWFTGVAPGKQRIFLPNGPSWIGEVTGPWRSSRVVANERTIATLGAYETTPLGSVSGRVAWPGPAGSDDPSSEVGIAGITVWLDIDGSGTLGAGDRSVVTDSNGAFRFDGTFGGDVRLYVVNPNPDRWAVVQSNPLLLWSWPASDNTFFNLNFRRKR